MLNRLTLADELSMRLFGDGQFEKSRRVMKVVDEINARHGRGTIRFSAAPAKGRWETKVPPPRLISKSEAKHSK